MLLSFFIITLSLSFSGLSLPAQQSHARANILSPLLLSRAETSPSSGFRLNVNVNDDLHHGHLLATRDLGIEYYWRRSIGDWEVQISSPTYSTEGWSNRGLTRFVHLLQANYVNRITRDWRPDERRTQEWPYSNFKYQTREKAIWIRPVQRSRRLHDTEAMPIAQMEAFVELLEQYVEGMTEGNDEEEMKIKIVGDYDRNHILATGQLIAGWWGANETAGPGMLAMNETKNTIETVA